MATLASMEARFPGLFDYDDLEVQAALELALVDALVDVEEGIWGPLYERGLEYLAAHNAVRSLGDADGKSGAFPVSQATADGVSGTFELPTEVPAHLSDFYTTRFGVKYLEMLRGRRAGPHLA